MAMREFTPTELASFNGLNGTPTYIAYEAKAYDVSGSWQWQRGRHQVVHLQAWTTAAVWGWLLTGKTCWKGYPSSASS
jgi:hypothetical protein